MLCKQMQVVGLFGIFVQAIREFDIYVGATPTMYTTYLMHIIHTVYTMSTNRSCRLV